MKPCELTPAQLCDVLNYVLGLPERIGNKTVIQKALEPVVVACWAKKPTRSQLETFADVQLSRMGLIPKEFSPRHHQPHLPREILMFLPSARKRVMA